MKAKKPVVVNPYSTGITLQLIPKAAVDKMVRALDGLRALGLG